VIGIGSGNLTISGLQSNAEVGALYAVTEPGPLAQLDQLVARLPSMAAWDHTLLPAIGPIPLTPSAPLLTSFDAPIFDQIDFPVSPHIHEAVVTLVDAALRLSETRP
jgi:hypothetical protein